MNRTSEFLSVGTVYKYVIMYVISYLIPHGYQSESDFLNKSSIFLKIINKKLILNGPCLIHLHPVPPSFHGKPPIDLQYKYSVLGIILTLYPSALNTHVWHTYLAY